MQITEKKLENAVVELQIDIPNEMVKHQYDAVFEKIQKTAKVDGFRKGKAPLKIIEVKYHKHADEDVANNLAKEYFIQAVKEKGMKPITEPVYEFNSINRDEPFSFKAVFEVFPTVELGKFKQIPAEERSCSVSDEDVARELDVLQENYSRIEKKEDGSAVQNSDNIKLKLKRIDNIDSSEIEKTPFREFSIIVGKSKDKYTIDKETLGMKIGEEKEIEITYPKDYSVSELAGKKVKYLIGIIEINKMILPDVNDEFAKRLNYESLNDMKSKIRENIDTYIKDKIKNEVKSDIMKHIFENSKFDIPDSMIRREMNSIYQKTCSKIGFTGNIDELEATYGINKEEFLNKIRGEAVQSIKTGIVLHEIGKVEDIKVSDDMINDAIVKISKQSNTTIEKIEEIISQGDNRDELINDLKYEAAFNFIYDNAKIKKLKPVKFEELVKEKVT